MEKWKSHLEGAMNNKRIGGRDTSILYVRLALCTRSVDKWQTRGFIKNAFRQVSSRVLMIYKTHPRVLSKGSTFHERIIDIFITGGSCKDRPADSRELVLIFE